MHDDDLLNFVWDCSAIEYFKEEENCDDYESGIKHFSDEENCDDYESGIKHFSDEDEYDSMKGYEIHIQHFG